MGVNFDVVQHRSDSTQGIHKNSFNMCPRTNVYNVRAHLAPKIYHVRKKISKIKTSHITRKIFTNWYTYPPSTVPNVFYFLFFWHCHDRAVGNTCAPVDLKTRVHEFWKLVEMINKSWYRHIHIKTNSVGGCNARVNSPPSKVAVTKIKLIRIQRMYKFVSHRGVCIHLHISMWKKTKINRRIIVFGATRQARANFISIQAKII